jgi:hypothetical protein
MFTALCVGCVVVLAIGTALRFGMLAGVLGSVGWLPEKWRNWMYDAKAHQPHR